MSRITDPKKQWLWFIGLWLGGLVSVSALAYAIRLFMKMLGLLE